MFDSMNEAHRRAAQSITRRSGSAILAGPGLHGAADRALDRQYHASETETIAAMDALIDWLPRHLPPEGLPRSSMATTGWTI